MDAATANTEPDESLTPIAVAARKAKAKAFVGHCQMRVADEDAKFIRLLAVQLSLQLPEAVSRIVGHYRACVARGVVGGNVVMDAQSAAQALAAEVVAQGNEPMVSAAGEELAPVVRLDTGPVLRTDAELAKAAERREALLERLRAETGTVSTAPESLGQFTAELAKDQGMADIEREVRAAKRAGTHEPALVLHSDAGEFPVGPVDDIAGRLDHRAWDGEKWADRPVSLLGPPKFSNEPEWPGGGRVVPVSSNDPTDDEVAAALADIEAARVLRGGQG